jgi:hypothetical protein
MRPRRHHSSSTTTRQKLTCRNDHEIASYCQPTVRNFVCDSCPKFLIAQDGELTETPRPPAGMLMLGYRTATKTSECSASWRCRCSPCSTRRTSWCRHRYLKVEKNKEKKEKED